MAYTSFTFRTFTTCALLSVGVSSAALAAATDIDIANRQAEIIQQRQQQQLQQQREEAQRAIGPRGANLDSLQSNIPGGTDAGRCHDIRLIDIRNAPHLSEKARQAIDGEFAGRCLGSAEIGQIMGLITKDYIEQGYVTARAYLPSQDLTTGTLLLDVIEGRIESFDIDDGGKESVSPNQVFPKGPGDLLNLRDLEQGIDQINRLSSNNAKMDIQPGKAPGYSTVVVRNAPTLPVHLFATYDDQGAASTGANQASATVSFDNFLGLNELLSYTHRESLPYNHRDHFSMMDDLNLSLPFGYDTISIDLNQSSYNNVLTLPSGLQPNASGTNEVFNLAWNRVAYRDHLSRLTVGMGLTTKDARNYFSNQYLAVSSRKLSVLNLKASWSTAIGGTYLTASFDHALGLAAFGAMRDVDMLPGDQPHAQFQKSTMDLRWHAPFDIHGQHFSYDSQFFAQQAYDTLYGSEQVMVGGIYSVRGFVNNVLSGDNGYYWRNDLSLQHPFVIDGEAVNGKFYVAVDSGWVTNRNADLQGGKLTGVAAGFQLQLRSFTWELFRSAPLSFPEFMTRESARTWFRMSIAI